MTTRDYPTLHKDTNQVKEQRYYFTVTVGSSTISITYTLCLQLSDIRHVFCAQHELL